MTSPHRGDYYLKEKHKRYYETDHNTNNHPENYSTKTTSKKEYQNSYTLLT